MPIGWDQLEAGNRRDYDRLAAAGRQSQNSPLGTAWPRTFTGSWRDFTNFSKLLNPIPFLETNRMQADSYLSSAVISRHFPRCHFRGQNGRIRSAAQGIESNYGIKPEIGDQQ
jgi:hypothetical protein